MPAHTANTITTPVADPLTRRLEIISLLARKKRKMTVSEIRRFNGFSGVDERTLQRDLSFLKETNQFNLVCDSSKKPYAWCVAEYPKLVGLTQSESLTLAMHEYLNDLLPEEVVEEFKEARKEARVKLEGAGHNAQYRAWMGKVRVVAGGYSRAGKPVVKADIRTAVYSALLGDSALKMSYKTRRGDITIFDVIKPVSPLALIQYGSVLYLVGSVDVYPYPVVLALHRIQSAKALELQDCSRPDGFDLDQFIQSGQFIQGIEDEFDQKPMAGDSMIDLVVLFEDYVGESVRDMPVSADQTVKDIDAGRLELKATVPCNAELVRWLSAFGSKVTVLQPTALRETLTQHHRAALAHLSKIPDALTA